MRIHAPDDTYSATETVLRHHDVHFDLCLDRRRVTVSQVHELRRVVVAGISAFRSILLHSSAARQKYRSLLRAPVGATVKAVHEWVVRRHGADATIVTTIDVVQRSDNGAKPSSGLLYPVSIRVSTDHVIRLGLNLRVRRGSVDMYTTCDLLHVHVVDHPIEANDSMTTSFGSSDGMCVQVHIPTLTEANSGRGRRVQAHVMTSLLIVAGQFERVRRVKHVTHVHKAMLRVIDGLGFANGDDDDDDDVRRCVRAVRACLVRHLTKPRARAENER